MLLQQPWSNFGEVRIRSFSLPTWNTCTRSPSRATFPVLKPTWRNKAGVRRSSHHLWDIALPGLTLYWRITWRSSTCFWWSIINSQRAFSKIIRLSGDIRRGSSIWAGSRRGEISDPKLIYKPFATEKTNLQAKNILAHLKWPRELFTST